MITMMTIKKIYVWCVQHWRWLVFSAIAIIAYVLGRKNSRGLFEQAKLARDHYKKESEAIENSYKEKSKEINRVELKAKNNLKEIEKRKKISIATLDEKKRKEIQSLIDDPEALDKKLEELGIKEV